MQKTDMGQKPDTGIVYKGIRPLQKLGVMTRELAFNNPLSVMAIPSRVPNHLVCVPPDPWPGDAERGRDLIAGAFHFAGQLIEKNSLSWRPPQAREEWIAGLHSFEWLRDLRSVGGDRARRMAREMVSSWLETCQRAEGLPWRPDVTGARVTSWIAFHDFFCASADEKFQHDYFASLARQARYLSRSVPGNLSGLELMKALKGLAYAGIAMENGVDNLEKAFHLIIREISAQILPDGVHISRAPQATFQFLQHLVDLRAALIAARLELPEEIQHAIDRITPAVKFFRHPDGTLGHFNGGQEDNAHLCEMTIMHSGARGRPMPSLPHAGYERLQMGRSSLIMDTGMALTPQYGERAHAGLLSFEYSYGRDRVIVNCGSAECPGLWRELLRSTAAHSAVIVDQRNACPYDMGASVMGRPEIYARRHEDKGLTLLEAGHNGYETRFGLRHRRIVALKDSGETLMGEDLLKGRADVPFAIRFHLHPGIYASIIRDGEEILLRSRSGMGWRFSAGGRMLDMDESVYGGQGEEPRRTQQIIINGVTESDEDTVVWSLKRER
ncbi:MAG: heparinase II/III family protein [Alphaproteobacteria bacterium]|nr:heparinase II/III family protein [Alphaproteobacteria bacterium]